ncbi:JAB domain-containing protein [uncultured Flavobacterium sp.]
MLLTNASLIIFCHNYPSTNLIPSKTDEAYRED